MLLQLEFLSLADNHLSGTLPELWSNMAQASTSMTIQHALLCMPSIHVLEVAKPNTFHQLGLNWGMSERIKDVLRVYSGCMTHFAP